MDRWEEKRQNSSSRSSSLPPRRYIDSPTEPDSETDKKPYTPRREKRRGEADLQVGHDSRPIASESHRRSTAAAENKHTETCNRYYTGGQLWTYMTETAGTSPSPAQTQERIAI